MAKRMNSVRRALVSAGLVGILGVAAAAPGQAAEPTRTATASAVSTQAQTARQLFACQGTIKAFKDDYLELSVSGEVVRFDLTKGTWYYGPMMMGARATVYAYKSNGENVAVLIVATLR
ncbi:hypothetical protein [Streptomyces curacoi]|uniref:DUF5666 domain-containing protein n=1 Tax=Streptomyces curacoi TaxID=146536 RepID=A0A117PF02_9ACTN|nr:hypothetical protein [Streptomyces curacoi]KUM78472.1 hypothetical protein AQI70_13500 [Streptomyces curacoi]